MITALTSTVLRSPMLSTLSLHLDYSSDIHLRLAVENDSEHVGGITLYGKSFGNYDQDIRVAINYAPLVARAAVAEDFFRAVV